MNPSVILSFRVKVKSPLYEWLESKSHGDKTMSDVVREIMEYHQMNNLQEQHLHVLKRQANNWFDLKKFLRQKRPNGALFGIKHFEEVFWDAFWAWVDERDNKITYW